jgi:hypothetical protein
MKEHRPGKRVARLAFVEAGIRSPPQRRVADPVQGEEGAFEPADLAERLGQRILFGISREPPHQCRRRNGSGLDRRREAQGFVPILADDAEVDGVSDHRGQGGIGGVTVGAQPSRPSSLRRASGSEPPLGQNPTMATGAERPRWGKPVIRRPRLNREDTQGGLASSLRQQSILMTPAHRADAIWPRRQSGCLVLAVDGSVAAWLSKGRVCRLRARAQGCTASRHQANRQRGYGAAPSRRSRKRLGRLGFGVISTIARSRFCPSLGFWTSIRR